MIETNKTILDACCGGRMFHYDKENKNVLFVDIRNEEHTLSDGRSFSIEPDMIVDFRKMPFRDETFSLVIFDPPHLTSLGKSSWMAKKYGRLFPSWEDDIREGFNECFRVLKSNGTLIFKWNETDISTKKILSLTNETPIIGNISGKRFRTHWITFFKN